MKKVRDLQKGVMAVSSAADPPIVISGGSITIEFNEYEFQRDQPHRFSNPNKSIRRIVIQAEGMEPFEINAPNGRCQVLIFYGSKDGRY